MLNRIDHLAAPSLILAAVLLLAGCATKPTASAPARDGVFVHIKSGPDQPHSVLMGLHMARMMAADRDVLVYFDVDGVKSVLQDSPDLKMEPFGSSHAMIQELVRQKVTVYACPGCMKALGKTSEQLLAGVQVAEREPFFGFTKGRVLALDY